MCFFFASEKNNFGAKMVLIDLAPLSGGQDTNQSLIPARAGGCAERKTASTSTSSGASGASSAATGGRSALTAGGPSARGESRLQGGSGDCRWYLLAQIVSLLCK